MIPWDVSEDRTCGELQPFCVTSKSSMDLSQHETAAITDASVVANGLRGPASGWREGRHIR